MARIGCLHSCNAWPVHLHRYHITCTSSVHYAGYTQAQFHTRPRGSSVNVAAVSRTITYHPKHLCHVCVQRSICLLSKYYLMFPSMSISKPLTMYLLGFCECRKVQVSSKLVNTYDASTHHTAWTALETCVHAAWSALETCVHAYMQLGQYWRHAYMQLGQHWRHAYMHTCSLVSTGDMRTCIHAAWSALETCIHAYMQLGQHWRHAYMQLGQHWRHAYMHTCS